MSTAEDVYRALNELPERERLRLVERVIHDLAARVTGADAVARGPSGGKSLIGLWADDADILDDVVETIMKERECRTLRSASD